MFCNSFDFLCRFYVFLWLNLLNFVKITYAKSTAELQQFILLAMFWIIVTLFLSMILSGHLVLFIIYGYSHSFWGLSTKVVDEKLIMLRFWWKVHRRLFSWFWTFYSHGENEKILFEFFLSPKIVNSKSP